MPTPITENDAHQRLPDARRGVHPESGGHEACRGQVLFSRKH